MNLARKTRQVLLPNPVLPRRRRNRAAEALRQLNLPLRPPPRIILTKAEAEVAAKASRHRRIIAAVVNQNHLARVKKTRPRRRNNKRKRKNDKDRKKKPKRPNKRSWNANESNGKSNWKKND